MSARASGLALRYGNASRAGSPAAAVLATEMLAEERLLWSGQPRPGLRFTTADALAMPFSLMWAGFAFFWEWTVVSSGAPLFFRLWGVPFVLMGLYLVGGRFLWDAHRRRRTFYGVTDGRVLIVTRGLGGSVRALGLGAIGEMVVTGGRRGAGTLSFGRCSGSPAVWFAGPGWPGAQAKAPAFEDVEDVRDVYELVRRAQLSQ